MARNVVCFGDSNTYGYCGDPRDCADGVRFSGEKRWTGLLQKNLGEGFLICEEGVVGRTTAFDDPMRPGMNGLKELPSVLKGYGTVDLLILMLGTNDTKARFGLCPEDIAGGMEQLVLLAKELPVWRTGNPEILIISPSHIRGTRDPAMYTKSAALAPAYQALAKRNGCSFLDAEEICVFNKIDGTHLTASAHRALAERLTDMIPELINGEYLEVAKKSENLNNSC